jgi:hypothetical protein
MSAAQACALASMLAAFGAGLTSSERLSGVVRKARLTYVATVFIVLAAVFEPTSSALRGIAVVLMLLSIWVTGLVAKARAS